MQGGGWKARDVELLDAVDALEPVPFEGTVWRAVREDRDPLQGHPSGGRWDPGIFDVLYTSLQPDGAVAEVDFHLSRQPVFPSKINYYLYGIRARVGKTLRFADSSQLRPLGVEEARYRDVLYTRTQEIGDAAYFLGFDGLIAPNARFACLNLVIFTDRVAPEDLETTSDDVIDWRRWRNRSSEEDKR